MTTTYTTSTTLPTEFDNHSSEFCTQPYLRISEFPLNEETPCSRTLSQKLHHSKGSLHKLRSNIETHELTDWILVARDSNEHNATKAYRHLPLVDWLSEIFPATSSSAGPTDLHEYEVLFRSVRLYLDIEWKRSELLPGISHPNPHATIQTILDIAHAALRDNGFTVEGFAIATASGACGKDGVDWKESYHIVFHTTKLFSTMALLKQFIRTQIQPRIPLNLTKAVLGINVLDPIPYGQNQCFRFVHQSKKGSGRALRPVSQREWPGVRVLPFWFLVGDYTGKWPLWIPPKDFLPASIPPKSIAKTFNNKNFETIDLSDEAICDEKSTQTRIIHTLPPLAFVDELCNLLPDEMIDDHENCFRFILVIWNTFPTLEGRALIEKHYNRVTHTKVNYVAETIAAIDLTRERPIRLGTLIHMVKVTAKKRAEVAALYAKFNLNHVERVEVSDDDANFEIPKIQINQRYLTLSELVFSDDVADGINTIIIRSMPGTGKTTVIQSYIDAHPDIKRIVVLSMRKALTFFIKGDWMAKGTPFDSYLDIKGSLADVERLIIQMESLHRLGSSKPGVYILEGPEPFDLVIVDESESALFQMSSLATHAKNHTRNCEMFERIIREGKRVLYADAFVGPRTLTNAAMLRGKSHCRYICNVHLPVKRIAIELFSIVTGKTGKKRRVAAYADFCQMAVADLKAGQRLGIFWASKTRGDHFVATCLKGLGLTHDTYRWYNSDNVEDAADMENVEEIWSKMQLVMYTSSITVGINYDQKDESKQFDKLYFYGSAASTPARDIAQALMRFRQLRTNTLIYTLDDTRFVYPISGHDAIRKQLLATESALRAATTSALWKPTPEWVIENQIFNQQELADRSWNYRGTINKMLTQSGYTQSAQKVPYSEQKIELMTINAAEIPDINLTIANEIRDKIRERIATADEKVALRKFTFQCALSETSLHCADELWDRHTQNGTMPQFWNLVSEKQLTLEQAVCREAQNRYAHITESQIIQRVVLEKILKILDLQRSCGFDDCDGVEYNVAELVPFFEPLAAEIHRAFGSQKASERCKDDKFCERHVVQMMKMVWKKWCGLELQSKSTRKTTSRTYTITIPESPDWNTIADCEQICPT